MSFTKFADTLAENTFKDTRDWEVVDWTKFRKEFYDKTKTVVQEYLSLLLLKEIYYERK